MKKWVQTSICIGLIVIAACISVTSFESKREVWESNNENPVKGAFSTFITKWLVKYFPLVEVSSMTDYDRTVKENWITALFSNTFLLSGYEANQSMDRALAENRNATDRHVLEEQTILKENKLFPGNVEFINGESYDESTDTDLVDHEKMDSIQALSQNENLISQLIHNKSTEFLVKNFFIVDGSTKIENKIFNVEKLLSKDCTMKKEEGKPQILIYHTHGASEGFSDSRDGVWEDSIIGVGEDLEKILKEEYGYEVIHDKTSYDRIDGKIDRNKAYNQALSSLNKTLKENPSIEVVIDLHRDAGDKKRVTTIDGKPTAQIMIFNGLSRNSKGAIAYLKNDNIQGNLAFSLQMKLKAMEIYPNFAKPIYLKGYRYNLHLKEKSLLIELGTNSNTVEEAKNAMGPLAKVLDGVLTAE